MVRLLVVDDEPDFRYLARSILEEVAGLHVVGEARDGEEAITVIRQRLEKTGNNDPDLLIVLGETFQAARQVDYARQCMERALAVAPHRTDAPAHLAWQRSVSPLLMYHPSYVEPSNMHEGVGMRFTQHSSAASLQT